MRAVAISLRDFRSYERAAAPLGGGLTVIVGPNGAGKTNLLEAVYVACTGRSCRTLNDRELLRFGCGAARVEVSVEGDDGAHRLGVGLSATEVKRMTVDGVVVERLLDSEHRPLVSVFMPDRLELIKGVPALRRAHLDQFVVAVWPGRIAARRAYNQTLAQRNALLARIRGGVGSRSAIAAWDARLAECALALMADRAAAVAALAGPFREVSHSLGLDGDPDLGYLPRARTGDVGQFVEELRERHESDIQRGFTGYGPHRDELSIAREGRELRAYGSQGQQRVALLSLLLAERLVIAAERGAPPLLLLDDVMSELDREHRAALVAVIANTEGQTLITTTDLDQVPDADGAGVARIVVGDGALREDVGVCAIGAR